MSADRNAYLDRDHYVYRLLGRCRRVLYVGCTSNLDARLKEHRRCGVWGHFHRVEVDGPFDYGTARKVERALIETKPGAFNIEWTPKHHRGRALNLAPVRRRAS